MTTIHKKVLVTDLDLSEQEEEAHNIVGKSTATSKILQRKSTSSTKKKVLNTLSGNFSRRSRSAECHGQQQQSQRSVLSGQVSSNAPTQHKNCPKEKAQSYLNELLKSKDEQLEKLLQRLATLHKYNEQFAAENQQLQHSVLTLQQRIELLRKQVSNCDQCQRLSKQLEASHEAQQTLDADVSMLKTLVYRLNVQIEAYQDQLRLNKSEQSNNHQQSTNEFLPQSSTSMSTIAKSNLTQWQQGDMATHTLAPLLSSYDEMLRDKDDLIQQYRQEFEHFTSELKRAIEENNRLLQQNATLKRNFGSWREERTRLLAQLEVCRTKAEAQAEKSDLAREKLVEVMHCYEQKVQTLVLDLDHTQAAYMRCKNELATLKSLQAQPPEPIAQSLQNCKQLLEELKEQHGKDKASYEQQIQTLQTTKNTLETRLTDTEKENSSLRRECEELVATKIQLEKRARDLEYTADVIKQSRERLKSRLRIALQWAQRLEQGQSNIQNTYDALKRLETIVKHKEAQVRGLQSRHLQEVDKFEKKLAQKDETIRTILKGKLASVTGDDVQK